VNRGDAPERIRQYMSENGFRFPVLLGRSADGRTSDVFGRYGVRAFPTNYLLDASGNVVFRSVGFDEAGLRSALAGLGLK
jgi:hypothetical protein